MPKEVAKLLNMRKYHCCQSLAIRFSQFIINISRVLLKR